jgi:poly-gamma-glutamate synthesis protein (capsule biosynthesis protein)
MPLVDAADWRVLYRRADENNSAATVDLRAVGDIMLGRGVAERAQQHGDDTIFARVQPLLAGDLAIGNLESPLTDRQGPLRPGPYRMPAPAAFAQSLAAAGFDALSLANNHALDVGPAGLQDAVEALDGAGIAPLGVGPDGAAAYAPVKLQHGGIRIALLGFNAVADPEDRPDESAGWGRAWLDEAALDAVRAARTDAGVVVVIVHWGQEYADQPNADQRAWAHKLVDAGADLIIGSHPHVLQPFEVVTTEARTSVVAYSLGNFIFDQGFSHATSTSVVLRVLLDNDGVALAAAAPIEIIDGQPRPLALASESAQDVLQRLDVAQRQQAWRWDGRNATPLDVPPDLRFAPQPQRLPVDLRGDGQPLWASLDDEGLVVVRDGAAADAPVVWRNEDAAWSITRIAAGDPNLDGRIELLLILWRPDHMGELRSHPFLLGWRGGRYRIIWGGSPPPQPIQDAALGDLDGDGQEELVVLEGGHAPGDPAENVAILRWFGWGFQREWHAPVNGGQRLMLQDLDADGRPDLVVLTVAEP